MQSGVAAERTSLDPLGAGALLSGDLFACVGAGALIGTLAGSVGVGVAIGAVIGIPAAIFSVYRRYGGDF
jgi:F0F1-type ATP synthase assembly protein I